MTTSTTSPDVVRDVGPFITSYTVLALAADERAELARAASRPLEAADQAAVARTLREVNRDLEAGHITTKEDPS